MTILARITMVLATTLGLLLYLAFIVGSSLDPPPKIYCDLIDEECHTERR